MTLVSGEQVRGIVLSLTKGPVSSLAHECESDLQTEVGTADKPGHLPSSPKYLCSQPLCRSLPARMAPSGDGERRAQMVHQEQREQLPPSRAIDPHGR